MDVETASCFIWVNKCICFKTRVVWVYRANGNGLAVWIDVVIAGTGVNSWLEDYYVAVVCVVYGVLNRGIFPCAVGIDLNNVGVRDRNGKANNHCCY